ncbi:MAG: DUF1501 domain-containing protein, partial [Verrucomicrobiae bacterium]|nr:DUF1501 domain-containing protein [Verrucomicrobiae bacterium]
MHPLAAESLALTRRRFFGKSAQGLGVAALTTLLHGENAAGKSAPDGSFPNFAPRAKRVIYLLQGGAPSHVDLLDWKPGLYEKYGTQLPESVRMGQRLTTMTASQKSLPMLPAIRRFDRYGQCGRMLSPFLRHTGALADDLC